MCPSVTYDALHLCDFGKQTKKVEYVPCSLDQDCHRLLSSCFPNPCAGLKSSKELAKLTYLQLTQTIMDETFP